MDGETCKSCTSKCIYCILSSRYFVYFILMTVSQMAIHSVHIAIEFIIAAVRALHLYHGMLYSLI